MNKPKRNQIYHVRLSEMNEGEGYYSKSISDRHYDLIFKILEGPLIDEEIRATLIWNPVRNRYVIKFD